MRHTHKPTTPSRLFNEQYVHCKAATALRRERMLWDARDDSRSWTIVWRSVSSMLLALQFAINSRIFHQSALFGKARRLTEFGLKELTEAFCIPLSHGAVGRVAAYINWVHTVPGSIACGDFRGFVCLTQSSTRPRRITVLHTHLESHQFCNHAQLYSGKFGMVQVPPNYILGRYYFIISQFAESLQPMVYR